MSWNLWLDDFRDPTDDRDWMVARDYHEAVELVERYGFPGHIAFDHDLGFETLTGYDFARWLVERDMENGQIPDDMTFSIHSANPVGADNIKHLMTNYLYMRKARKNV